MRSNRFVDLRNARKSVTESVTKIDRNDLISIYLATPPFGEQRLTAYRLILITIKKVYKKSSQILHIWILRRFFVYTFNGYLYYISR